MTNIQSELSRIGQELMSGLEAKGFEQNAILKVMEDVDIRLKWTVGSMCSLYSRSAEKWYDGEVIEVFNDNETNAEWLMVRYGPNKKTVQRFCADIRCIEFGDSEYEYDDDAIQFIVHRLKGTKVSEPEQPVDDTPQIQQLVQMESIDDRYIMEQYNFNAMMMSNRLDIVTEPSNSGCKPNRNIFGMLDITPQDGEEMEMRNIFPQILPSDAPHALQRIQFIDRIYCRWIESKLDASINRNANNIGDAIDIGISETYNFSHFLRDFRQITKAKDLLVEQEVSGNIMECDSSTCHRLRRRDRGRSSSPNIDTQSNQINEEYFVNDDDHDFTAKMKEITMQRIMDSAHCYLVHSIRIPPLQIEEKQKQLMALEQGRGDGEDDELRDYRTEAMCTLLTGRRELPRFRDCNRLENEYSKFIAYDVTEEQKITTNVVGDRNAKEKHQSISSISTILDEVTTELQKWRNKVDTRTLSMFRQFVEREKFDSETVHDDLGELGDSNIMKQLSSSRSLHSITSKLITRKTRLPGTYSCGYRFFYWPLYRNNTAEARPVFKSVGNHYCTEMNRGYTLGYWYIETKYADFKEEALTNKSAKITLMQWLMTLSNAKMKLEEWRRSGEARLCGWSSGNIWSEAYGLEYGSPVTVQHIMALLFYCDFTKTCEEFSRTFRKIWSFESDDSLKHRHSEVAIWARLLRELIEGFGFTLSKPDTEMMNRKAFYHGIAGSLLLPRQNICGPLSTSSGMLSAILRGFQVQPLNA